MIFVVPKFEEVFKQIPGIGELPAITQGLQAISKFLVQRLVRRARRRSCCWSWASAFVKASKPGRRFFDRVKLKLPIIGHADAQDRRRALHAARSAR